MVGKAPSWSRGCGRMPQFHHVAEHGPGLGDGVSFIQSCFSGLSSFALTHLTHSWDHQSRRTQRPSPAPSAALPVDHQILL